MPVSSLLMNLSAWRSGFFSRNMKEMLLSVFRKNMPDEKDRRQRDGAAEHGFVAWREVFSPPLTTAS